MAPEVYEKEGSNEAYKEPLDCWSAGIIMYYLICGAQPFDGDDLEDKIRCDEPDFSGPRWTHVSPKSKDLISQLLKKSPISRLKAKDSLDHPFFEPINE